MKKVEIESFLKSFFLFFISIGILISIIYYINYTKELEKLDDTIFSQMKICSFDLECKKFTVDLVLKEEKELYKLYKKKSAVESYFPITGSVQNVLKLSYDIEKYKVNIDDITNELLISFLIAMMSVFVLSTLFSIYVLFPLRNALRLTEEFVKDILHDFNTPLSTLRLNSEMLSGEFGENTKISRIKKSVQTILNLQTNLRAYLDDNSGEKESVDLGELIQERVSIFQSNYRDISYINRVVDVTFYTNKDALIRILDNLLSNASKYNKKGGSVEVYMKDGESTLCIKDSGRGIKNPKKIFDRFYKENERGIGIGLHIVKKLSRELGIKVSVETKINEGSIFYLKMK